MQRLLLTAAISLAAACAPRAEPAPRTGGPDPARVPATEPAQKASRQELWPARTVQGYDPHETIRLVSIPAHPWDGNDEGSAHFRDVMTHTSPKERWTADDAYPSTIGHETHHGLLAEREKHEGEAAEFFYFERGFGAYVPSPKQGLRLLRRNQSGTPIYTPDAHTNMRHVRDHVPAGARKLASGRYQTYLMDPDRESYAVLYLFDEWNAYVAGARISIETYRAGYYDRVLEETVNPDGSRSSVSHIGALDGMVDFLYFSSAGLLALAEREPEYLRSNEQLRAVYAVLAEETVRWLSAGSEIELFRGFHAEELLEHFATSPENQRIRDYLTGWLGAEWTARVFGRGAAGSAKPPGAARRYRLETTPLRKLSPDPPKPSRLSVFHDGRTKEHVFPPGASIWRDESQRGFVIVRFMDERFAAFTTDELELVDLDTDARTPLVRGLVYEVPDTPRDVHVGVRRIPNKAHVPGAKGGHDYYAATLELFALGFAPGQKRWQMAPIRLGSWLPDQNQLDARGMDASPLVYARGETLFVSRGASGKAFDEISLRGLFNWSR